MSLTNFKLCEIQTLQFSDLNDNVFDLEVETSHSYIANDYVVHNSGGQCLTRAVAGVGVPQLTAVQDCVKEAKKHKVLICADGGINCYADFSKALVAGADFVMAGSIFGGHAESGGDIVYDNNDNPMKELRGMSSWAAMSDHGTVKSEVSYRASEGRVTLVPYRGPIQDTFNEILGAIRSTCTYVNARNIQELKKNGEFIRVNQTLNKSYERYTVS